MILMMAGRWRRKVRLRISSTRGGKATLAV
jgi:hypothetical protein